MTVSGVAVAQPFSIARRTRPGWKLKNVAITTSADTAPIAALRDKK